MNKVWRKLKILKNKLKQMNRKEFSNTVQRIQEARIKLEGIQKQIDRHGCNTESITQEKKAKKELAKWSGIEESIMKQKSRIKWLKLGEANTTYFYACAKSRQAINHIGSLFNNSGQLLNTATYVETEILKFFKQLLGTAVMQLPVVSSEVMKQGINLNRKQQLSLIRAVTEEEVKQVLQDIDDNKALGRNGYNAFFYKKSWHIIGKEVTQGVLEFFENPEMCRVITDNIIMSHELIKGYGRKNISPRCMLKIDIHKAYDSVEWVYVEQVMRLLGLPEKYVKWVMACISIRSYLIIVNGKRIKPFEAKRGLRQGDSLSPLLFVIAMKYLCRLLKQLGSNKNFRFHPRCAKMNLIQLGFADDLLLFCKDEKKSVVEIHNQFQRFSKASGLVANTSKSSIYFGGVDNRVQQMILEILGYTKGDLPFRYLGVLLSTKRISTIQCEPLIDKMLSRVQSWTIKFLSYAGRAALIKSVLGTIQNFWAQVFIYQRKLYSSLRQYAEGFYGRRMLSQQKRH
uniref:Reverse transcriptase domain-containing protein n=1 Tax=Nicotiana tabacum TaxID=4097 RepID=A0A1S4BRS6_TOBAC|nr:PREDICTED: uncharacterized protein LOC107811215 [Nicotiana tabacum]